ncbi:unnamed protein product [Symbiodinium necroappetens]|uniref:Uncharacterized protein n=1 Tax=Symbiodinium necroappetens TaxID=1628268 RepID=A0A812V9U9_9DINO|nr:unnamed protein product [Symbiodinium necroappetens]
MWKVLLASWALSACVDAGSGGGRNLRGRGGGNSDDSDEGGFPLTTVLIIAGTCVPFLLSVMLGVWRYRRQLAAIVPMPEPTNKWSNEKVTMEDRRKFQDEEEQKVKAAQKALQQEPNASPVIQIEGPRFDVQTIFRSTYEDSDDESNSLFGRSLGSGDFQAAFVSDTWVPVGRMRSMSDGDLRKTARRDERVEKVLSRSLPLAPKVFLRPPSDAPNAEAKGQGPPSRSGSKGSAGTQASKGSKPKRKARTGSKGSSARSVSKSSTRSSPRQEGALEVLSADRRARPRLQTN